MAEHPDKQNHPQWRLVRAELPPYDTRVLIAYRGVNSGCRYVQRGYERGHAGGSQEAQRAAAAHLKGLRGTLHQAVESALAAAPVPVQSRAAPTPSPASRRAPPMPVPRGNGHAPPSEGLTGPEQRILDALSWLESTTGIAECEQMAVAFLAGYTYGAGGFNNPKSRLNVLGMIEYVAGRMRLTETGRAAARPPDEALTAEELHARVLARLPGPEQRILRPVLEAYPEPIAAQEVAEKAGYTFGSGGFNNPRSRLRTLGLIEYIGGQLKAADALFPTSG